jgi:hypothetical protein
MCVGILVGVHGNPALFLEVVAELGAKWSGGHLGDVTMLNNKSTSFHSLPTYLLVNVLLFTIIIL